MTDYTTENVYGIVLLPETALSESFIENSQQLAAIAPSDVVLNSDDSLAHATVVHMSADRETALTAWKAMSFADNYELTTFTLYIRPMAENLWVGLDVLKTSLLTQLNESVVDSCNRQNIEVLTEHSDNYWPHVTLGRWKTAPKGEIPISQMTMATFSASVALTRMGGPGTVVEVLASTKL